LIFGKKAGIDLPRTEGEYKQAFVTIFSGTNPSDLGEDIRQMESGNGIVVNKVRGVAPARSGNCN
jgi:hypothetical protein